MPLCKHCGVELDEGLTHCPLCHKPLNDRHDDPAPAPEPEPRLQGQHSWFWEFTTFMALAAMVIVFAADFAFGLRVTWSRMPLAGIFYAWLVITGIRFLGRRGILLTLCLCVSSSALLWFLELNTGGGWFLRLAFPIVVALGLAASFTVLLAHIFRAGTQSILAIALLMLGFFLLALEAVLTSYILGAPSLSWSLMVLACILPFTGFLLYMHKRMKRKGFSFEKFFHA